MRLFIFESHPVQYHAPVYRELHRLCEASGTDRIQVFYATDVSLRGHFDPGFGSRVTWDEPLLAGYPAAVLNNEDGRPLNGFNSLTGRGIAKLIRRERPDAVLLTGLAYRFDWAVYRAALLQGIPIWLRMETQDKAFARGRIKSVLRSVFYRLAYFPVRSALAIGRLNSEHYTRHGLGLSKQGFSRYCVVNRFEGIPAEQQQELRRRIRREAGLDEETTVLLFCGKLQPKKNPEVILEALAKLPPSERKQFSALFVGSGESEAKLRLAASGLKNVKVVFTGFKNQTEIAPYYLAADVLILPSRQAGETWGLVVNEALQAGRRVIVSKHVGCHADFQDLPSVRVFDGSRDELARVLSVLPGPASANAQKEFMKRYSIQAAAAGIARAMNPSRAITSPERESTNAVAEPASAAKR